MTLFYPGEKILNHRIFDKFFVDYSVDDLYNNLTTLAQLHYFGNHLEKKLDEGLRYRKGNAKLNLGKYKDFVGNINIYNLLIHNQETENYYYESDEEDFEKNYKLFKSELISNLEQVYLPQFSLEKLVISFLENENVEYQKQSKFFKIDFNKEFSFESLEKRDSIEGNSEINSYKYIYTLFENIISSNYYENRFYPAVQQGNSPNQENLILRYFPREEFNDKTDKKIIQNRLIDFLVEIVEIIYFGKNQYPPTFYVRVNLHNHPEKVIEFQSKNQIAILVDQPNELDYWKQITENNSSNQYKYVQFIGRWFDLQKALKYSDVIIIAQYLNSSDKKIGLIRKGTYFLEEGKNKEFKIFQISNVREIDKKDISIFNSIIPQSATLSPVKQRLDFINFKFNNRPSGLKPSLDNISPKLIELLCLEWLRSDLCDAKIKIKYQLLKFGGNYADVDVFGKTFYGKTIACQVTYSKDIKTIKSKIEKMRDFESDIKIIFSNKEVEDNSVTSIPLQKVWNDLSNDKEYLEFLKFLSFN